MTSPPDVAGLLAPARSALSTTLVVLDFDGTLGEIVLRPEDARLVSGAFDVLTALAERAAALAIVTGRPAETAVELGELHNIPGVLVLGHYGLQRWHNGALQTPAPDPAIAVVRASLPPLPPGATVEDKTHSVVVHTRGCADPAAALELLREPIFELAAAHRLEVVPGRFVWEIRPPGVDKGQALETLVAEVNPGFAVIAGDDIGDLPMFEAAGRLPVPVVRIAVVSPGAAPEVAAAADVTVDGPSALIEALRSLL